MSIATASVDSDRKKGPLTRPEQNDERKLQASQIRLQSQHHNIIYYFSDRIGVQGRQRAKAFELVLRALIFLQQDGASPSCALLRFAACTLQQLSRSQARVGPTKAVGQRELQIGPHSFGEKNAARGRRFFSRYSKADVKILPNSLN
jgi:hypothetical protein